MILIAYGFSQALVFGMQVGFFINSIGLGWQPSLIGGSAAFVFLFSILAAPKK